MGYVSSGVGLEIITNTAQKEIDGLAKEDVVVVWGGANNESEKGTALISNFVKQTKHTNLLVVNAPKRHDLPATSCVNNEVTIYNRELYKRIKASQYVKIIDSEVHREYFTKHGMHMNTMGKELMAWRITQHIRKTFLVRQTPPITLKWRQESMDTDQEGDNAKGKDTQSRTGRKEKETAGN
jgi:hypothetical protein